MRIAEFARATGLSPRMLRHYEQQGWLRPATLTEGGHRRFDPGQVATARLLVALHRTGMALPEAASLAAHPEPERLRVHAERARAWVDVVANAAHQDPVVTAPLPRREVLPWASGIAVVVGAGVHQVCEVVRETRARLVGMTGQRRRLAFPSWPDGPDGPRVELLSPSYDADRVDLRVVLAWPVRRAVPRGAVRVRMPDLVLHAAEVPDWERATLVDVHTAHRAVDGVWAGPAPCCSGGSRWQLYDGETRRTWVARHCLSATTPPPAARPGPPGGRGRGPARR